MQRADVWARSTAWERGGGLMKGVCSVEYLEHWIIFISSLSISSPFPTIVSPPPTELFHNTHRLCFSPSAFSFFCTTTRQNKFSGCSIRQESLGSLSEQKAAAGSTDLHCHLSPHCWYLISQSASWSPMSWRTCWMPPCLTTPKLSLALCLSSPSYIHSAHTTETQFNS